MPELKTRSKKEKLAHTQKEVQELGHGFPNETAAISVSHITRRSL